MSGLSTESLGRVRLRLPATSANLGPGFDAAAVALDFSLQVEAAPAAEFSIHATGRDWERCARLEDNLILEHYKILLKDHSRPIVPLAISMDNGIPLGMGCGSSAAGRLAAIAFAVHFGRLGWSSERIVEEACVLEGHPDNAAACWLGGFVTAASEGKTVHFARVVPPHQWRAIVVLPSEPLPTVRARAVLPATYSRADVVANIQSVSLLGLAFAQPYRAAICPLLPRLLPLAGQHGILGAALSGAGPAVIAIVSSQESVTVACDAIRSAVEGMAEPELLVSRFVADGASQTFDTVWRRRP
jgi:homoserine kinase